MGKLSATGVKAATRPGRLGDGDGLFLVIGTTGSKSRVYGTALPPVSKTKAAPIALRSAPRFTTFAMSNSVTIVQSRGRG